MDAQGYRDGTSLVQLQKTTATVNWTGAAALIEPEPWMQDALCAQVDPEFFFPEKGGSTWQAKQVCRACEVVEQCLAYALRNKERHGIWGGFSERDRREMENGTPRSQRNRRNRDGLSVAERRDAVREHYSQGLNDQDIARRIGCSGKTVLRIRQDLGLAANYLPRKFSA